jgi:hypothetical protein
MHLIYNRARSSCHCNDRISINVTKGDKQPSITKVPTGAASRASEGHGALSNMPNKIAHSVGNILQLSYSQYYISSRVRLVWKH